MKIALISDIHEDVVSLKKALRMIETEKCDQIICLGDILGYPYLRAKYSHTRNASECISLIRKNCQIVLLGNHDLFHIKKLPVFFSGFNFPDQWFNLTPEEQLEISENRIWNYTDDFPIVVNEKETEYLFSLPEFSIKEYAEEKILFSHFFFPNFSGYLTLKMNENTRLKEHFKYLSEQNCLWGICGHMHIEGLGICYEPGDDLFSQFFGGFNYYSFGKKRLKTKLGCVTIPALADNSQVNGFAIFDSEEHSINALSLNTNRRFIL
ncbi:MAG TPA: metallophosphoesterase family protein [Prolixibacteraceae bacterium]|nr:metallophosphoesterase family protein [Prolixibacteraceae bacterium]